MYEKCHIKISELLQKKTRKMSHRDYEKWLNYKNNILQQQHTSIQIKWKIIFYLTG